MSKKVKIFYFLELQFKITIKMIGNNTIIMKYYCTLQKILLKLFKVFVYLQLFYTFFHIPQKTMHHLSL